MNRYYIVKESGGLLLSVGSNDQDNLIRVGEKDGIPIYKSAEVARKTEFRKAKQKKENALKNRQNSRSIDIQVSINIADNDLTTKFRKFCKDLEKKRVAKVNVHIIKKIRGRKSNLSFEDFTQFMDEVLTERLDETGYNYTVKADGLKKRYMVEICR